MTIRNSPWLYLALIIALNMMGVYAQYQLTPISQEVIYQYGLTKQSFSTVFTAPMVPAILMSIPAGILIDRLGVRPVILAATGIALLGFVLRPFTQSFTGLYATMFLSGVIVAVINATIAKTLGQRFSLDMVGRLVGMVMACASLGMVIGTATTAMLPGIREAFIVAAVLMAIVSVLVVFFLYAPKVPAGDPIQGTGESHVGTAVRTVMKSKNIWITGVCCGLVMALNVAMSSYLPMALQENRGMGVEAAGAVTSLFLFGYMVGAAAGPPVMRLFPTLRVFTLVVGLCAGLGGAFGWLAPQGVPLIVVLFITGMCIGALVPVFLSLPVVFPEIGPRLAGTGGGVIATLQLLGAVLLPGFVMLPFSGEDFGLFFVLAGAGLFLMALLAQFIRLEG